MKKASVFFTVIISLTMIFSLTACNKEEPNHTVSFITNGGSVVSTISDDIIECAPASTKDGYSLDGWYYDSELTDKVEFPVLISVDMNFYAKWYKSLEQYKNEFTEKLKTEIKDDEAKLIGTLSDKITVSYTYTYEYKSDDNSYITQYSANVWLTFEYGNFENASGQITYNYENKINGVTTVEKKAFYSVLSLRQTGENYLIKDGYFLTLTPSDVDETELLEDFNFYLHLAQGKVRSLAGFEYKDTILDYNRQ